MFDLSRVQNEVREGMTEETRCAWESFAANRDYYECRGYVHLEKNARREAEDMADWESRPKLFSYLCRRAIRCLTQRMYSPGPQRTLEGDAGQRLEAIYESCRIDAVMSRLDVLATLNGYAAVQVAATGKPDRPIRLYLWGADEFRVYHTDDDPMNPVAIVTKSVEPGIEPGRKRRRWEIWTADVHEVWVSKDFDLLYQHSQGTTAESRILVEPNTYGILPFAYAWNELPVDRFEVGGIGQPLRLANAEVDRMLTDLSSLLNSYNRPKGFIRNVGESWRYAERIGNFTRLPQLGDAMESLGPPEPFYLQPEVNVTAAWEHIDNYIDNVMSDLDIPLSASRGRASYTPESGIALAIRNEPLRSYLSDRRTAFAWYETELARVILTVLGNYYGDQASASGELDLDLAWPEITFGPASPESMQTDQAAYDLGLDSLTTLLMRQRGWSRDQAHEHLERVAEDRIEERDLLAIEPAAMTATPPTTTPEGQANQPSASGDGANEPTDDETTTGTEADA